MATTIFLVKKSGLEDNVITLSRYHTAELWNEPLLFGQGIDWEVLHVCVNWKTRPGRGIVLLLGVGWPLFWVNNYLLVFVGCCFSSFLQFSCSVASRLLLLFITVHCTTFTISLVSLE